MSKLLWTPYGDHIKNSNMWRFINFINDRHNLSISSYEPLYNWSIEDIADFWVAIWEFVEVKYSKQYDQIVDNLNKMPGAKWFSGARLNFAENLLKYKNNQIAIISKGENQSSIKITYAELYDEVARVARSLRDNGVKESDRVVGFMPNMPETVIAMLATASIGAVWSSCSPDFGINGVLDRFYQIKPKSLFTADGYSYKGKHFDSLKLIPELVKKIQSIEQVIVVPYTKQLSDISGVPKSILYEDFKSSTSNM